MNELLPLYVLITMRRSFIRPHLSYGDIIHEQSGPFSFPKKH